MTEQEICRRMKATATAIPVSGKSCLGGRYCLPFATAQLVSLIDHFLARLQGDNCINDSIPLNSAERLCFALIDSLQSENRSYRLGIIGEFVWEVPRQLGRSEALENVTACMLDAHQELLRRGNGSGIINPKMYVNALQSLQYALHDPEKWRSCETLCATVLLHRIEVGILF
jgi:hypothetical protein